MITSFQVHSFFQDELPVLKGKANFSEREKRILSARSAMYFFLDYTRLAIAARNLNKVKKCLLLAEKLYNNGDLVVRLLIENIYVYSFPLFMPHNRKEKQEFEALIPNRLYAIHLKQMMGSGC